jgi:hypothetical protein
MPNFMKIRPMESELFRAVRRTDRHGESNSQARFQGLLTLCAVHAYKHLSPCAIQKDTVPVTCVGVLC